MDKFIDQIKSLEKQALSLEPDSIQRHKWNQAVNDYAESFLSDLAQTPAYELGDGKEIAELKLEEKGKALEILLKSLNKNVDHVGIKPASPGYVGYIPGGGIYPSALADYLSDVTNRTSALYFIDPGAVRVENLLIKWVAELMGLPDTTSGNLASGGSLANLIALVTARDAHQIKSINVASAVVYLSDQAHYCLDKNLHLIGLGEAIKRRVPLDEDFRMIPEALEKMIEQDKASGLKPWLIITTAGTTNTGAVDPLKSISQIAKKHELWFHVDAAYGGFFILSDQGKALFNGVELADSIVLDPHKSLFLPYGLGIVLIRNKQFLLDTHTYDAPYLKENSDENDILSPASLSPELTKPFRGLRMWLPLQLLGIAPFRAALEEKLLLAQYFYNELKKLPGIEFACKPQLSIVVFRYIPKDKEANAFNLKLLQEIREESRVFLSGTTLKGHVFIRFACLSFRTHLDTVDYTLDFLRKKLH